MDNLVVLVTVTFRESESIEKISKRDAHGEANIYVAFKRAYHYDDYPSAS